ncbi:MAG TPA: hypothetical protein VD932_05470 [Aquabacterium sp.]|nr:hypothetical protein [Aquabacterium sp.]
MIGVVATGAGFWLAMVQMAMAAFLAWSCFCRVTKTNGDTRREVRWAMCFEGIAVGVVGGAPIMPWLMPRHFDYPLFTTPVLAWLVLLLSILVVQAVTAKHWAAGVPSVFQLPRASESEPSGALSGGTPAFVLALLALVSLAVTSDTARAQAPDPELIVHADAMRPGAVGRCGHPSGCLVFAVDDFKALAAVLEAGSADCRRGPRT